jgi:muramidase (phage lysozyme)
MSPAEVQTPSPESIADNPALLDYRTRLSEQLRGVDSSDKQFPGVVSADLVDALNVDSSADPLATSAVIEKERGGFQFVGITVAPNSLEAYRRGKDQANENMKRLMYSPLGSLIRDELSSVETVHQIQSQTRATTSKQIDRINSWGKRNAGRSRSVEDSIEDLKTVKEWALYNIQSAYCTHLLAEKLRPQLQAERSTVIVGELLRRVKDISQPSAKHHRESGGIERLYSQLARLQTPDPQVELRLARSVMQEYEAVTARVRERKGAQIAKDDDIRLRCLALAHSAVAANDRRAIPHRSKGSTYPDNVTVEEIKLSDIRHHQLETAQALMPRRVRSAEHAAPAHDLTKMLTAPLYNAMTFEYPPLEMPDIRPATLEKWQESGRAVLVEGQVFKRRVVEAGGDATRRVADVSRPAVAASAVAGAIALGVIHPEGAAAAVRTTQSAESSFKLDLSSVLAGTETSSLTGQLPTSIQNILAAATQSPDFAPPMESSVLFAPAVLQKPSVAPPAAVRPPIQAPNQAKAPERNDRLRNLAAYTPLLNVIAKGESGGNYNAYYGNGDNTSKEFTEMSVRQVLSWQKAYVKNGSPSSAVGKYQFIQGTLRGLIIDLDVDMNEKFDAQLQDRLAIKLLERRGLREYAEGRLSRREFAANLAQEWASLPKMTGSRPSRSFYAGDGLNSAHVSMGEVYNALEALENGLKSGNGAVATPPVTPPAPITPEAAPAPVPITIDPATAAINGLFDSLRAVATVPDTFIDIPAVEGPASEAPTTEAPATPDPEIQDPGNSNTDDTDLVLNPALYVEPSQSSITIPDNVLDSETVPDEQPRDQSSLDIIESTEGDVLVEGPTVETPPPVTPPPAPVDEKKAEEPKAVTPPNGNENKDRDAKPDTNDDGGGACAVGSVSVGIHKVYTNGKASKTELCAVVGLPSSGSESTPGNKYYVRGAEGNALILAKYSKNLVDMVAAAKADGVNLQATSSYRTNQHQIDLCPTTACIKGRPGANKYVAQPGHSEHQNGEAIDFKDTNRGRSGNCRGAHLHDGKCVAPDHKGWRWLNENGAKFGFKQYIHESWHWSPKD